MSEHDHISDETLTAFLDGALDAAKAETVANAAETDPSVAARLAALDLPMGQLRQVMDPATLGAPAMPAALAAANADTAPRRSLRTPIAVAAAFVAGIAVTSLLPDRAQNPDWVEAVASYQALYVADTLSAPRQDTARTSDVLARAQAAFDVTLDPALDVAGLEFKRAQMLGWNGKPLLQMAYLTPEGVPMALCLTKVGAADQAPTTGMSHDLAGVSWVENGIGYYLVGGQDAGRVTALSQDIIARL